MTKLKVSLLALATVLATSASASAADLYAPAPVASWTGFYVGGQIGAGENESTWECVDGDCAGGEVDSSLTNIVAGGCAGYNLQLDRFVLGVEGDISGAFGKNSMYYADWAAIDIGYEISQDYYASIRGRFGFLVTDDFLVFGTAGVAFANYTLDNPSCSGCSAWDSTTVISGKREAFVFGGGLEYALSENVHLKGEYLYADFGNQTREYDGGGYARFESDLETHQVRVGVSYAFR